MRLEGAQVHEGDEGRETPGDMRTGGGQTTRSQERGGNYFSTGAEGAVGDGGE